MDGRNKDLPGMIIILDLLNPDMYNFQNISEVPYFRLSH